MTTRKQVKLVHEGQYLAEIEVELEEGDGLWSPYLSMAEAKKLDELRIALRRGDLSSASRMARIYKLTPVHAA
jgi:hypothetical protein